MKRSPELTPLSHDHHQALFAALQLKRAEDASVARAALTSFFETHGRKHFRIEEEILLPGWFDGDADADRSLAGRVLEEHLLIRRAVRLAARGELSLDELNEAGDLLEAHVRFEERTLFPAIEARLAGESLVRLGSEIAAAENAQPPN